MSRSFVVKKKQRLPRAFRSRPTHAGEALPDQCLALNPLAGASDVFYEGLVLPALPEGKQITVSNRSGDRKKY